MKSREDIFLEMALGYKKMYNETAWWKFRKRAKLKKDWDEALVLMIRFAD